MFMSITLYSSYKMLFFTSNKKGCYFNLFATKGQGSLRHVFGPRILLKLKIGEIYFFLSFVLNDIYKKKIQQLSLFLIGSKNGHKTHWNCFNYENTKKLRNLMQNLKQFCRFQYRFWTKHVQKFRYFYRKCYIFVKKGKYTLSFCRNDEKLDKNQ